ncbi:hypothetical protein Astex_1624 [Asticcacaulis excentricus CB 48]|uniref:Uncharacterized protein n=1 Tax=Asticcacaulis excentricus (strain ATCC 15261 / DSM 4724 / KCTC 12464 / NCIMB 9791 / VKM B-1370 / CB 48) TaxID=573065 RepID=E8RQR2_ASTEC|nr:hypothetical protein Astex_1624 [Asticcacaulis excentricus CB 48]
MCPLSKHRHGSCFSQRALPHFGTKTVAIKHHYAFRREVADKPLKPSLVRPLDIIVGLSIGMALAAFLIF